MIKYHYNIKDFVIERFFSYTANIPHKAVITEVDMNNHSYYPNICEKFDEFYEQLRDEATKLVNEASGTNIYIYDNKTVFQIRNKYSGEVFFIGKYDFRRAIGTECYVFDGRIYDFKTHKKSHYVTDVVANSRGMWMKFEP